MHLKRFRYVFFIALISLAIASSSFAVTVDGSASGDQYVLLGSWTQADTGFGDHGISDLYGKVELNSLNIFVAGEAENNFNDLFIIINTSSNTNGVSAGVALPSGSDGFSPFNSFLATMDFEADFGIRLTPDSNNTDAYPSIIDYRGGGNTDTFLTTISNNGSPSTIVGGAWDGVVIAYDDSGTLSANTGQGLEISIPLSNLGATPKDTFQIFALYGNDSFMSANTIPEISGQSGTNLGNNPDFSITAGNQNATLGPCFFWIDDFETDTSANYIMITGDSFITYEDYTTNYGIPAAPRTSDLPGTSGLVMQVNTLGVDTAANAFTSDTFSGDFKVVVDIYGYVSGGGTTIQDQVGINHTGNNGITFGQDSNPAVFNDKTDGYWFQWSQEGGTTNDFIFQEGEPTPAVFSDNEFPGLWWGDGADGSVANGALRNASDDFFDVELFPSAPFPGAPTGSQWTTYEMIYDNGYVVIKFDGKQVISRDDPDDTFTAGRVLLGLEDGFNSISSGSRAIFDNFVVECVDSNTSPVAGTVASPAALDSDPSVDLTWDGFSDVDSGVVGYTVSVGTGGNPESVLAATDVNGAELYNLSPVPAVGVYQITVVGRDTDGNTATALGTLTVVAPPSGISDWMLQ